MRSRSSTGYSFVISQPKHINFRKFSAHSEITEWALIQCVNWTVSRTFKNLPGLWDSHSQSRRPQSCHVRSRAGRRRRPRGHLWRRGRPARGPSAPLSVWTTALWAGHGLGAAHIHTTAAAAAAATATRRPRRARHWPAWPGSRVEKRLMSRSLFYCCAVQSGALGGTVQRTWPE